MKEFTERVLTLRLKWPFSITSWIRTVRHNTQVGGVVNSYHIIGEGIDIVFDIPKQTKNVVFEKDCELVGLRAIFETDHYHLQRKEMP